MIAFIGRLFYLAMATASAFSIILILSATISPDETRDLIAYLKVLFL